MKGTRNNLFSKDRFLLFTGTPENQEPNQHFQVSTKIPDYDVVTPSEKNDPREFFLLVIQKKDAEIR
jgi:hypothetical protein